MKIKDSYMLKGIGILCMIFWNLFINIDVLIDYKLTGFSWSALNTARIAALCHIYTAILVFVTAYGTARQGKEHLHLTGSNFFKHSFQKYLKFSKKVLFILVFLAAASYIFDSGRYLSAVWGWTRQQQVFGIVCNALGLADLFHIAWFDPSWQYIGFYVGLIFIVPVIQVVIRKCGWHIWAVLSFFLTCFLGLFTPDDSLCKYIFAAVLGVACAEFSLIEKISAYLNADAGKRTAVMVGSVVAFPIMACMKLFTENDYIIENLLLICVLCIALCCINKLRIFTEIFCFLGRHSMCIWLIHTSLLKGRFQGRIYGLKNIWIIFAIVLLSSLLAAVLLDMVYFYFNANFNANSNVKSWVQIYSGKKRMLLVFLCVAGCYAAVASTSVMAYLTNDDAGIQACLASGVLFDVFTPSQNIHIILNVILFYLYKYVLNIQWWYVYSHMMIIIGMICMHYTVFYLCSMKKITFKHVLIILFILDGGFLFYPIANISFTIVPAVLGCGMIGCIFLMKYMRSKRGRIAISIVSFLGYILLFMHRQDTGFVLLCYFLLMWLYVLYSVYGLKNGLKRFTAVSVLFAAAAVSLMVSGQYAMDQQNGLEFVEYNAARAAYMDYPHDSYLDHKKIYQDVGWDETLYKLVSNWCFMDDRINAESFRYLTENSRAAVLSMQETMKNTLRSAFLGEENQLLLLIWCVSFIPFCFAFILFKKFDVWIFFVLNNLGSLLLIGYQAAQGRLIYRSLIVVLLPAFFINLLLSLEHGEVFMGCMKRMPCIKHINIAFEIRCRLSNAPLFISKGIFYLCMIACGIGILKQDFNDGREFEKMSVINRCSIIDGYVLDNLDHVYITFPGIRYDLNPKLFHADAVPINTIDWGGSGYHSKGYRAGLEKNGISKLDGDVFRQDHVYFISSENLMEFTEYRGDSITEIFYSYLKEQFHAEGFLLAENIDNCAYVYKFVFAENRDEFTNYYDIQNGKRKKIWISSTK